MSKLIDINGQIFGKWQVLSFSKFLKKPYGKIAFWLCQCECGTIKELDSRTLRHGRSKSCGCNWKTWEPKNKLRPGEAKLNALYQTYIRRANQKNRSFELSKEEFKILVQDKCYYCDSLNIYNGIDRVDSTIGYEKSNCVTCCSNCNYLKSDFTKTEFFEQIKLIYNKHMKD